MTCQVGRKLLMEVIRLSAQEYDRPNSAFMLFYERSEELEPCRQPKPPAAAATQPAAADAARSDAASEPAGECCGPVWSAS